MEVSWKKRPGLPWKWACALSLLAHVLFGVLLALAPWLPPSSPAAKREISALGPAAVEERLAWDPNFAYGGAAFQAASVGRPDACPIVVFTSRPSQLHEPLPFKMELEIPRNLAPAQQTDGNNPSERFDPPVDNAEPPGDNRTSAGVAKRGAKSSNFFEIKVEAKRIVFVVDCSSSMGESGAFDGVRRELLSAVENLSPKARFQIVVFNTQARPLLNAKTALMPATVENKGLVAGALQSLRAEGRTVHRDALPLALAYLPEVIFFVTDAGDLSVQHVRRVTEVNGGRAAIHVLQARRSRLEAPHPLLQILARRNGGKFRTVDCVPITGTGERETRSSFGVVERCLFRFPQGGSDN